MSSRSSGSTGRMKAVSRVNRDFEPDLCCRGSESGGLGSDIVRERVDGRVRITQIPTCCVAGNTVVSTVWVGHAQAGQDAGFERFHVVRFLVIKVVVA